MTTLERPANPLLFLFGQTWRFAGEYRRTIVKFWALFIGSELMELYLLPVIWAQIMTVLQRSGRVTPENLPILLSLLSLTLGSTILIWALHGPGRVLECQTAFTVRANYRKHLLSGITALPMAWHVEHHSGDTIDKIEKGTTALYNFSEDSYEVIYAIISLLGSYIILSYFSPPAALTVIAMVFVTGSIIMNIDRVLVPQYGELNKTENGIAQSVLDTISNISTVIILRVERLVLAAISEKIDAPFALFSDNRRRNEFKWFLTSLCCSVMMVTVLGVYFWQHLNASEGIIIGEVYLLIKYLDNIRNLFFRFAWLYGDIVRRTSAVMNAEELAKDFADPIITDHVLPPDWQELQISNLNFSYFERDTAQHLADIAVTLKRGQRIAFIGESGSGKTTLLKILRDLYQPHSLTLTADGVEIPSGFAGIEQAVSLIPQNPEIFANSILENITHGAEHDMATIFRCTNIACFTDVVEQLPRSFDSTTKEKGVNLSGGQQQRLALARGFFASLDKDIILLDEPTNNLDVPTEKQIYQNIFREFEGKTIVSSIHRLHLLPLFDLIYLFEDGRIIASGSHEELLAQSGYFRELWREFQFVALSASPQ